MQTSMQNADTLPGDHERIALNRLRLMFAHRCKLTGGYDDECQDVHVGVGSEEVLAVQIDVLDLLFKCLPDV